MVGVEAHGEITAGDYEQVFIPPLNAAQAQAADGKVRVLYVLGHDFPGITAGGAWKDAQPGLSRLRHWERVAIVSDADWMHPRIHGLGWMIPGEAKVFATDEGDAARDWVSQ